MHSLKLYEGEAVFSFIDDDDGHRWETLIEFDDYAGNFGTVEGISEEDAKAEIFEAVCLMHPERDDLKIIVGQV